MLLNPVISEIVLKLVELEEYYDPFYQQKDNYKSVILCTYQIQYLGYSDELIGKIIQYLLFLRRENQNDEASILLLLCVAVENKYAIYLLGRELFNGKFFKQNYIEAYKIISAYSETEDPDAICDLALFYEKGIIVKKSKEMALKLYKKASDLGLERAEKKMYALKTQRSL